ncbi:hypothetical protein Q3G72_007815 [Acer saccharum]|nr:hypothetical protein Q3G72_007815 [Acer saccharum]
MRVPLYTETDEANNGYQKSGIRFPQDSGERPILDRGEYDRARRDIERLEWTGRYSCTGIEVIRTELSLPARNEEATDR